MPRCDHDAPAGERPDTLRGRMRHSIETHLSYRRRASLRMLLAFIVTFGLLRLLTYSIHSNLGPFHDVTLGGSGGVHLHHYIWGLLLLIVCGFLALSLEAARWHPILAIPFGIGLALVLDEFALLLELKDVYWANDGRWSVDVAVLVAALLATYYLAQCFWHQLAGDVVWALRGLRRGEERLLGRDPFEDAD